jgi:hypothetical protein
MKRSDWLDWIKNSNDPEARRWRDRGFGKDELKDRWKDPEFRSTHAAAVRAELSRRWKDPEFRSRNAAAVSAAQLRRWRAYRRKPSP